MQIVSTAGRGGKYQRKIEVSAAGEARAGEMFGRWGATLATAT